MVDALTYSHRGLHSRAPSRPYFPFLFRGYRLYTGEQSTWIDRNMNGERTLPFTFPLHSLYNRNHVRISVGSPTHHTSGRLYGVFFEDINHGADGGLNATW